MAHYVIVSGGRDNDSPETRADIHEVLSFLSSFYGDDLRVMHGAAQGVDTIAAEICEELGITVKAYPANWDVDGRAAGPIRNAYMAERVRKWWRQGHTGELIAFRGGNGTANMIEEAERRGIPITRIPTDGTEPST